MNRPRFRLLRELPVGLQGSRTHSKPIMREKVESLNVWGKVGSCPLLIRPATSFSDRREGHGVKEGGEAGEVIAARDA